MSGTQSSTAISRPGLPGECPSSPSSPVDPLFDGRSQTPPGPPVKTCDFSTQTESWMALSLITDLIQRLQAPLTPSAPTNTPSSSGTIAPSAASESCTAGTETTVQPPISPPTPQRCKPVTMLSSLDFSDLTVEDIEQTVTFKRVGKREVAHFGEKYRYGKVTHAAQPYPEQGVWGDIIARLSGQIRGFSKEWSCTVTRYLGGKSHMPFHSDRDGTDVYCVSLGEPRNIHFRSVRGQPESHVVLLPHGSVHHMTDDSQDHWEHGIPPTDGSPGTRLSLTFRLLKRQQLEPPPPPSTVIPPIQRSNRPSSNQPLKRILYLGDSMLRGVPLQQLMGSEYHVVQRPLYRLEQLGDHEHLFEGCAVIVIASGINDLSRYNHTSQSLWQCLQPLLSRLSARYHDTKFVFASILRTNFPWLNTEVEALNEHLFHWTTHVPNSRLLDTHDYCSFLSGNGWDIVDLEGNGIHITAKVKEAVGRLISDCTRAYAGGWARVERWPLRDKFKGRL